ncbi:MAG: cytochrome d ubiquinol oxidase subunit II [Candidatus Gracilibacteria bacterium]|nr:cytochrome d ubiquinol oxidase subunit II [Candidatus Gracilibacteria bacterium]
MFETLSTLELQQYLWFIISFIGAGLVFMLYVQGGQTLAILLAKSEAEKTEMLNTVGKRYEITFTSLVTFGGAFFAVFPLFYSTSFGGAFFVWFAILFLFIIEGVSFKYRKKVGNFLGKKTYEVFLLLNGIGVPLLIGVAVATFFTGANFHVEKTSLLSGDTVSVWDSAWHGLEALWNPLQGAWLTNISFGVAIVLLTTILASLNIIKNINDNELVARARKYLLPSTLFFLVFFLFFLYKILTIDGFGYDPLTGVVSMKEFKYLHNLLEMPFVTAGFVYGVLMVVLGIVLGYFTKFRRAFWFSALGTFFVALTLLLFVGWNNTVFYPSLTDLQSSLTIENASSSRYTLIAISYASLLAPVVLAYISWVWNKLRDDGIGKDIMNEKSGSTY